MCIKVKHEKTVREKIVLLFFLVHHRQNCKHYNVSYLNLCQPAEGRDWASDSGIIDVELAFVLQVES